MKKTIAGIEYPPSAFLVVEDEQAPSTWHLQVRGEDGKPDHRLMGAAWAALHGGYRGNKYQGPEKGAALSKLRALYQSEEMPLPSAKEFAEFKQRSGVMVSWKTPDLLSALLKVSAERAGIPGVATEPAEEMHLTLAYLGEMSDQKVTREQALTLVSEYAKNQPGFRGIINGTAVFERTHLEGAKAVVALVDAPNLPDFRQGLVEALQNGGMEVAKNHGYTPHITMAYVPEFVDPFPSVSVLPVPVEIDSIVLNWGDEKDEIRLAPMPPMEESEESEKMGKRNSMADQMMLNQIVKLLLSLGGMMEDDDEEDGQEATGSPTRGAMKENGFYTVKGKDGRSRWLSVSSTAYVDHDGEIVSTKALENDVSERPGVGRGPLRWQHIGKPDPITKSAGPGYDIGECDFGTTWGRLLVESGTFKSEEIAEAVAKSGPYEVSIGFFRPVNEPSGPDRVYSQVKIFERSLLPAGRASNRFTAFGTQTGGVPMSDKAKAKQDLIALLGPELGEQVATQLDSKEKQADSSGLKFKERWANIVQTFKDAVNPPEEPAEEPQETKSVGEMSVAELIEALKAQPQQEPDPAVKEDTLAALKESQASTNDRLKAMETAQADMAETMKGILDELEAIIGKPGHRPSTSENTVKETPLTPGVDARVLDILSLGGGAK